MICRGFRPAKNNSMFCVACGYNAALHTGPGGTIGDSTAECLYISSFTSATSTRGQTELGGITYNTTDADELMRQVLIHVESEYRMARSNWPPFNSAHEGIAVLAEELDELWQHVKTNQKKRDIPAMFNEACQVAAMAVRFALEICNEERGRK